MKFFRLPVIVGALPVTLTNGTTADATQVMSDLNWIVNQVNANAAPLVGTALTNVNNNFTVVQSGVAATQAAHFPIASQVQNDVFNTLSSTLGTNTLTARISALPLPAYAIGQVFTFQPSQSNTQSATMSIDGLGSGVFKRNGQQLVGGELGSGSAIFRVGALAPMPVFDLLDVPTTTAAQGSSLVLIRRQVVSGVSAVDFTSGIDDTYDEYLFVVSDAFTSGGTSLYVRISQAGVFKSGASDYAYNTNWYFGATPTNEFSAASSIYDPAPGIGTAIPVSGELRLFSPSGSARAKVMTGFMAAASAAAPNIFSSVGMYVGATSGTPLAAIDGLRFLPAAGTLSGAFSLYGLKKS